MGQIKTIRYAIIDSDDRLCKVGSSRRPATFSTFDGAMKWAGGALSNQRLVEVSYKEVSLEDPIKYGGSINGTL